MHSEGEAGLHRMEAGEMLKAQKESSMARERFLAFSGVFVRNLSDFVLLTIGYLDTSN